MVSPLALVVLPLSLDAPLPDWPSPALDSVGSVIVLTMDQIYDFLALAGQIHCLLWTLVAG